MLISLALGVGDGGNFGLATDGGMKGFGLKFAAGIFGFAMGSLGCMAWAGFRSNNVGFEARGRDSG